MDIYQAIIENDENKFAVSRKLDFQNPSIDIWIDEQLKAKGSPYADLATKPLFPKVNVDKLNTEINQRFIKLLNNYVIKYDALEEYTQEEKKEIDEFLTILQSTKVWSIAFDYIKSQLGENVQSDFNNKMFELWFKPYTNWYNGKPINYCSGFEHIFVGEEKYNTDNEATNKVGEISGYHNWIKFVLDEQVERVNFLGYKYGVNQDHGLDNPTIVTLQMLLCPIDLNGEKLTCLFKRKGGFFVGCSPECQLALGTVAFFENKNGMFSNDKKLIRYGDSEFNLVLYCNVNQDGSRGNFIRSFFPELPVSTMHIKYLIENAGIEFAKESLAGFDSKSFDDPFSETSVLTLNRGIDYFKKDWQFSNKNWRQNKHSSKNNLSH